eukprot:1691729-Alexandrium_andersonii.AAC.1
MAREQALVPEASLAHNVPRHALGVPEARDTRPNVPRVPSKKPQRQGGLSFERTSICRLAKS